ncbi:MAG TPA: lipid II flippase MurJ, partial [Terriglobales bacterium]
VSACRLGAIWLVSKASIPGLQLGLNFDGSLVPRVVRLGGWAFGDDLSRRIGMNSEQVILGALSSFQQVALFGVGSRLPAHMYQFAARGLSVLFPTLSEHHARSDTARLRRTFSSALRICVTGFVPLATFGAICSGSLMRLWAGPAYEKAGPVLACLLISSLSIIVMLPSDLVLYSHGQIPQAARFSIAETVGKVAVTLLLAARFGAVGVAAGIALWHWCVNLFLYFPAACKVAKLRPAQLWARTLWEGEHETGGATALVIVGCAYIAGVGVLAAGVRLLSTLEICILFSVTSILYCSAWTAYTVLPMWRDARARASAIP